MDTGFADTLAQTTGSVQPPPDLPEQGSFSDTLQTLVGSTPPDTTDAVVPPEDRAPHNWFTKALDFISRPRYGIEKFAGDLLEKKDASTALSDAAAEMINPIERTQGTDLIAKVAPDFAKNHPVYSGVLGLALDIGMDPTTYVTFGVGDALKVPELIEEGGQLLNTGKQVALSGAGKEALSGAIKELGMTVTDAQVVRQTADQKIAQMIAAGAENLVDKGGVKFAGKTILSSDLIDAAMQRTGMNSVMKAIGNSTIGTTIGGVFSRNLPIAKELQKLGYGEDKVQEFLAARKALEASGHAIENDLRDQVTKIFGGLSKDEYTQLGDIAGKIDDATSARYQELLSTGQQAGQELVPNINDLADQIDSMSKATGASKDEILTEMRAGNYKGNDPGVIAAVSAQVRNEAPSIAAPMLDTLNKNQRAAYSLMRSHLDDMASLEMDRGLLQHSVANYFPRVYDLIKDGDNFVFSGRLKGLSTYLSSSQGRTLVTREAAKAAGLEPELDAAVLYAMRARASARAIANDTYNKTVLKMFGANKVSDLPKSIQSDISFTKNQLFPQGLNEGMRGAVSFLDSITNTFKKFATTMIPSFGPRQFARDAVQMYLANGVKTYGAYFSEVPAYAAGALMLDKGIFGAETELGQKIANSALTTTLGQKRTLQDIYESALKLGVVTGHNSADLRTADNIERTLKLQQRLTGLTDDPAKQGMLKLLKGGLKYTNWPSQLMDMSRMSHFINGIKMGYTDTQAAGIMEKGLFNYANGLSQAEKQLIRRIIPFYTFQRFGVELLAKTALTAPGRIVNGVKVAQELGSVWNKMEGGQTLSDSERKVLPGYLLEQPNVFAKFDDKTQAVFRTFDRLTPLDALGSIDSDGKGDVDWKRTLQKSIVAQFAPYLKLPIEYLADKNFFTGAAISREANPQSGRIGNVTPEGVIGNIMALLSQTVGSKIPVIGPALATAPGLVASKVAGTAAASAIPQWTEPLVKQLLGWEEHTDPKTGKRNVYINPYIAWGATSMYPALNRVIRFDRPELTPREKAMDLLGGIGTVKLNLQQERQKRLFEQRQQIEDLKTQYKRDLVYGRQDEAEKAQSQLTDLLQQLGAERAQMFSTTLRGQQ